MDPTEQIQAVIEERKPEFIPFLKFIESTQDRPVEAQGHKVSYDDGDLTVVVIAVYLYAIHDDGETND